MKYGEKLLYQTVESGWLESLASSGMSHVFLSPVLAAAAGSTHGYDVVDHDRVDPAIGGDEGFDRFTAAARDVGLGVIVDLVPNHVAPDPVSNEHWWDPAPQRPRPPLGIDVRHRVGCA